MPRPSPGLRPPSTGGRGTLDVGWRARQRTSLVREPSPSGGRRPDERRGIRRPFHLKGERRDLGLREGARHIPYCTPNVITLLGRIPLPFTGVSTLNVSSDRVPTCHFAPR